MTKIVQINVSVPRYADGMKCSCGGYAGIVDCTPEEEAKYGCGRPGCCSRAFVCGVCGNRMVGCAEAPEME